MRRGERWVWGLIGVVALFALGRGLWQSAIKEEVDPGIPFYSTAPPELARAGWEVYRRLECKNCHTLWTVRNMLQSVPAPALDGIGSLRDEQWFYSYFSAADPQSILPTRLKPQYRMPSYAHLDEQERRTLAAYMASLKVEDWYLEETRKAQYEKLTGKPYRPQ